MSRDIRCRFCDQPALAVFDVPAGCLCFPADREQALCHHHVMRSSEREPMHLREDLTVGAEFTGDWMRGGGLVSVARDYPC